MRTILALILLLFLSSCIEVALLSGFITTRIATREKTLSDTKKDINIAAQIFKNFSQEGLKIPGNSIDITVNESRVLLTGIVSQREMAKKAVDIAWRNNLASEVINEIQIAKNKSKFNGFRTYFRDLAITTQIESRFFVTSNVSLLNVKVNTVNSVVYLIGVANTEYEIQKITNLVSKIKGVRKVVSHIITLDDDRRRI